MPPAIVAVGGADWRALRSRMARAAVADLVVGAGRAPTLAGYVGMDLHLAARAGAAGHGGQIVASHSTRAAVGDGDPAISFRDLSLYRLKGIPLDVRLFQVAADILPSEFPPLRPSRR